MGGMNPWPSCRNATASTCTLTLYLPPSLRRCPVDAVRINTQEQYNIGLPTPEAHV